MNYDLIGCREDFTVIDDRDIDRWLVAGLTGELWIPRAPSIGGPENRGSAVARSPARHRVCELDLVVSIADRLVYKSPGLSAVGSKADGALGIAAGNPTVQLIDKEDVSIRIPGQRPHQPPVSASVVAAPYTSASAGRFELKPGRANRPTAAKSEVQRLWQLYSRVPRIARIGCVNDRAAGGGPTLAAAGEDYLIELVAPLVRFEHALPGLTTVSRPDQRVALTACETNLVINEAYR